MDVCSLIAQRLKELGVEQRALAGATQVTESYISQLLSRKKAPPAPDRTDIYGKMEKFLKLPGGKLARLADLQRREELRRQLASESTPLLKEVRDLILRKCDRAKERQIRAIFEKEPFGELERLVAQKLLDVAKNVAREELDSENWLHLVARVSDRSYEEARVIVLEFLETDVFHLSLEHCESFLDPMIESWDIDLATFGMQIVLNRGLAPVHLKRLEFVETDAEPPAEAEPGLREFLRDTSLSGNVTEDEIAFLRKLRFKRKRPTALYYYRELQNLRDPLHFRAFKSG